MAVNLGGKSIPFPDFTLGIFMNISSLTITILNYITLLWLQVFCDWPKSMPIHSILAGTKIFFQGCHVGMLLTCKTKMSAWFFFYVRVYLTHLASEQVSTNWQKFKVVFKKLNIKTYRKILFKNLKQ